MAFLGTQPLRENEAQPILKTRLIEYAGVDEASQDGFLIRQTQGTFTDAIPN